MLKRHLLTTLFCLSAFSYGFAEETFLEKAMTEEIQIDLKNPTFVGGVIKTTEGGVVEGQGTRIQAKNIEYINRIENGVHVKKIVADGDLLVIFKGKCFVGKSLNFDFNTGSGSLEEGKTFVDLWFLGGDRIDLKEDGTYAIFGAFLTTSASIDNSWEISSSRIQVNDDKSVFAKNIRFQFFKIPIFWLPTFKSNLKFFKDPPVKYKVVWDKGLGPRLTMRYRVFAWQNLDLFFRLDYRLKRGFGTAIESIYRDPEKRTTFITKSFGAHDKVVSDERSNKRYRLQGLYKTTSRDETTLVHLSYDKLSDNKLISDFKSDDFTINTEKRTRLLLSRQEDIAFARLTIQPKINSFQSVNQELPRIVGGIRALELGDSGVLSQTRYNVGYLDYAYAHHLYPYLKNFHAIRLEANQSIYRPFNFDYGSFTPQIGLVGIFYNNSPTHETLGQAVFQYGFEANSRLYRKFSAFQHTMIPYAKYEGYSSPRVAVNQYYVFDIDDGYAKFNTLRLGMRQVFSHGKPFIAMDTYTIAFFNSETYKNLFPKAYQMLTWYRPSYQITGGIAWNFEEMLWDFVNLKTLVTVNANLAFGIEMRHRSKYDWRKANHDNFVLESARSIQELLQTPLSDGRDTLITKCQVRLSPRITCFFSSHHGWGRSSEPRYNGSKVELVTLLTGNWRMKVGYQHSTNDDRFSFNIFLAD